LPVKSVSETWIYQYKDRGNLISNINSLNFDKAFQWPVQMVTSTLTDWRKSHTFPGGAPNALMKAQKSQGKLFTHIKRWRPA
jgi:hypothetical protein